MGMVNTLLHGMIGLLCRSHQPGPAVSASPIACAKGYRSSLARRGTLDNM